MQTNFFRQLAKMELTGDLQLTFRPTQENSFVLSVLLRNEQCGDEAGKLIPPLNLRGTAEELDNGFFESISEPMQSVSGLMVDMKSFMKQVEEAKKQSAMEKEKADKEKKEKEAKEKKYKEAIAKAEALEKKRGQRYQKLLNFPTLLKSSAKSRRNTKNTLPQVFLPKINHKLNF